MKANDLEKTLVLFDVDGTLLPTSRTHAAAFSAALRDVLGIDARLDEIQYQGLTDRLILIELAGRHCVGALETRAKMAELTKSMLEYSTAHMAAEALSPLPGASRLLETLSASHAYLGIVTGSFEPIAMAKLGQAGIANFFHPGIGGFGTDSESRAEMLRLAISRAEVLTGSELNIFYVGDTPRDVEAGKSSNVKVIAVATGPFSVKQLEQSGADLVLRDLTESEAFIDFLA